MFPVEYVVVFSLAGMTSFAVAGVGWKHRNDPVGRWFVGLCVSAGLWSFADAAAVGASTFDWAVFWYAATWVGEEFVVFFLLLFTLEYTGYEHWVTRRRLLLYLTWPVASIVAIATNGTHHLVWSNTHSITNGAVRYVAVTPAPWYTLDLVYGFGVAFLCLGLLFRQFLRAERVYRKQVALLVVAVAFPTVTAAVSLLVPGLVLDLTPLSFTVTAVLFLWATRRYHFLDVVPVAHRLVLEYMDDAMVVVGTGDEVLDFNASAARLFHLSDADVGRRASAVFDSNAVGTNVVVDGDGDDGDGDGGYTATVEGELRQFEVDTVEVCDARDVERGTLYLFHDVTERYRREEWFRTLTENATDITMVLDADATVQYVGESVRRVLGIDPATLDHGDAISRAHEDDRETVRSALEEALDRPGETVEFGCRVRNADGGYQMFDIRAKNLLFDPIIEGVVVNAHDVTEREANERRLKRQNEQLDAFASAISHDLRNPLNVAQGYLDLLRDDPAPEHVDRVERAHERMETIVSDVLTLARSGSRVGETEPVDLREAAEAAWANVVTQDGRLTVAADGSVEADRARLLHLFENLFRNSVEHGSTGNRAKPGDSVEHGSTSSRTQSGDVADHGSASGLDPSGADVSVAPASDPTVRVGVLDGAAGFYVADDGPGIPPEDRDRVFESGFSTSESGTGLGLAIVRAVADAHGWEAACVAADGGGARFEFRDASVRESPSCESE